MMSAPACSSAMASSGVVAVPMVTMLRRRHSSRISRGGMPQMKLKTGTFASRTARA
jgi:hypothetical protein